MKIYSKSNFIAGLIGLAVLGLYAAGVWEAHMGNWVIAIAFTVSCLYTGLTKSGSGRAKHMDAHYDKTARKLHGKYYSMKKNLPLIVLAGFFAVGMVLKILDIWMPGWVIAVFMLALVVSAAYSIGLHREITEYIDEHIPQEDEPEP